MAHDIVYNVKANIDVGALNEFQTKINDINSEITKVQSNVGNMSQTLNNSITSGATQLRALQTQTKGFATEVQSMQSEISSTNEELSKRQQLIESSRTDAERASRVAETQEWMRQRQNYISNRGASIMAQAEMYGFDRDASGRRNVSRNPFGNMGTTSFSEGLGKDMFNISDIMKQMNTFGEEYSRAIQRWYPTFSAKISSLISGSGKKAGALAHKFAEFSNPVSGGENGGTASFNAMSGALEDMVNMLIGESGLIVGGSNKALLKGNMLRDLVKRDENGKATEASKAMLSTLLKNTLVAQRGLMSTAGFSTQRFNRAMNQVDSYNTVNDYLKNSALGGLFVQRDKGTTEDYALRTALGNLSGTNNKFLNTEGMNRLQKAAAGNSSLMQALIRSGNAYRTSGGAFKLNDNIEAAQLQKLSDALVQDYLVKINGQMQENKIVGGYNMSAARAGAGLNIGSGKLENSLFSGRSRELIDLVATAEQDTEDKKKQKIFKQAFGRTTAGGVATQDKRALDIIYEMAKANDRYFGSTGTQAGKSFVHNNNIRENQDAFLIESISPFVKMAEDEAVLARNGKGSFKGVAYREDLSSLKKSSGRFKITDSGVQGRDSFTTLNESSITRALGLNHKNASEYTPVIKEIDFNGFIADKDKRQQEINEELYMQFLEQNGVVKNKDGTYSFGMLSTADKTGLSKEAQKALSSEYVYHVNHGQAGTVGRLIRRKEYEAVENNWQNEFSNPLGQLLGLSGNAFGSFWGNGMDFKKEYNKFSDFAKFMDALNKGHSPGIDISGSSIDFVNMLNQNGEKIDFGGIIGRLAGISNVANIADKSKIGEMALKSFGELSRFDQSIADKAIGKGGQSPRIAAVKFDPAWAKEKFGFDDLSEGIGYIESSLLAQGTSQIRGGLAAKGMLNASEGLIRSLATNFGGKTIELDNGGKRYSVEMPSYFGGTTELIAEYDKDNQLVGSNYDAILPASVIKNKDKIKDIYNQKIATGASEAEARKAGNFALSALFGVTGIDVMNRAANDAETDNIGVQAAQWIQMSPAFMKHQAEAFTRRKKELYTPEGLIRLFGGRENIDNNEMVKGLAGEIEGISPEQFMIENSREINNKREAYLQSLQRQMAFGVVMDLDSRADKKSDAQMLNLIANEKGGDFTSKYQMTNYKNQRLVTNPYMVKLAELGVYEDEENKKLWTEALNSIDLSQQGGKLEGEALEKAYNAFKEKGGKSSIDFSKFNKEKFASSIETLQGFRKTLNEQFGNEVFGSAGIDPEKLLGILTMTGFGKEGDKYQLGKGAIDFDNMNQAMLGIIRSPTGFGQIIGRTNYASFLAPILSQLGITGQKGLYLNYSDMQRISGADWDGDMIKSVLSKKYDIENLSSMSLGDRFKWMADKDVSGGLNALRKSGDMNALKRSDFKTDIDFLNAIEKASNNSSLVDDIVNTEAKVEALKLYKSLDELNAEVDKKVGNEAITNVTPGATGNQQLDRAALLKQITGLTMAQVKMGGGSAIASRLSSLDVYSPDNAYWARLAAEGNHMYDIFTTDAKKPTTTKLGKEYLQALGLGAEWGKVFGMIRGSDEFNMERQDENTVLFSTKDGTSLSAKDLTMLSSGKYMYYDSLNGISKKAANGGFAIDETQFMSHNNKQHMMATLEALTAEQMGLNDTTWADYFSEGFTKAANYKRDKEGRIITTGKLFDTIAEKADLGKDDKSGAGGGMGYGLFDYLNWTDANGNERQGLSDVVNLMQNARWIKGQQAGGSHMIISSEERNILALQALAARKQIEEVATAVFRNPERDEYGNPYVNAKDAEGNDIQLDKAGFTSRLMKQAGIPTIEMMLGGHKVKAGTSGWQRISTGITEDQLLTMLDSESASNRFLAASILKNYTPGNRVDLANFQVDNTLKDQQHYVRSVNGSSASRTLQRVLENGIDPDALFNPEAKKDAADVLAGKLEEAAPKMSTEEINRKVESILTDKDEVKKRKEEFSAASRLAEFIAIGDRIRSGEKATIFDLETTGKETSKDQITQISSALLGVKDYYGKEWNAYVRPNRSQLAEKKKTDLEAAERVTGLNFEELMSSDTVNGVKVLNKAEALESFKRARNLSDIGIGFNNTIFDDKVLSVQSGQAGVSDTKFKTSVDVLNLLESLGQADVRVGGTNILDYYKEKIARSRAAQVQKEFIDEQMKSDKMQTSKKEYEDAIKSMDEDAIYNNDYLEMIAKSSTEYKKTYDDLIKNPLRLNADNKLVGGSGSHKLTTLAGAMLNLPTEALASNESDSKKAHNSSYDVDMTSALYANLMSKAYGSMLDNPLMSEEEIANAKAGQAYFNNVEAKIREKILGQEQFIQTEAEIDKTEVDRVIAERQEATKKTNKLYGQEKVNAEKREEKIAAQVTAEAVKENPPTVVETPRSLDAFVPSRGFRETTTGDGEGVPNKEEPKISTMRSYFQKTGANIEEKVFSTLMDDITKGLDGAIEGYQGDKKSITELRKQYGEAVKNGQYGIALESINGIQSILGNNESIDNTQVGKLAKYINAERTAIGEELAASGNYDHLSPLYNPGVKTLEAARTVNELEEETRKEVRDRGLISIRDKNAEGKETVSQFKINPQGMVEVANEATANMQWFMDMNQQLSDVRKNNSKANYVFTEDHNVAIANKAQAIQDNRLKNMMKMRAAALEIYDDPKLAGIRDSEAGQEFTNFVLERAQGGMMDQYLRSVMNEVQIAPDTFNRDMNNMMAKQSATGSAYLRYQTLQDKQTSALEELKARETALNTLFTTTSTGEGADKQDKIVANLKGGAALISGAREQLMKSGFNNIPELKDLAADADYTDVYKVIKAQIEKSKGSIQNNKTYEDLSKLMVADLQNASNKETASALNRFYGISGSTRPTFQDRVTSLQSSMMSDVLSRRAFFDNLDSQKFDYKQAPELLRDKKTLEMLERNIKDAGGYEKWAMAMARQQEEQYDLNQNKVESRKNSQINRLIERDNYQTTNRYLSMFGNNIFANALKNQMSYKHQLSTAGEQLEYQLDSTEAEYNQAKTDYEGQYKQKYDELKAENNKKKKKNRLSNEELEKQAREAIDSRKMDQAKERYDKINEQIDLNKKRQTNASGFKGFATSFAIVGIQQLINSLTKAIKVLQQFAEQWNTTMAAVSAKSGITGKGLDELETKITAQATKLKTSVISLANTYKELFASGFDSSNIEAAAEAVTKFATVTGQNATKSIKQLVQIVNSGLVSSLDEAMDKLTSVSDLSVSSAADIAKVLNKMTGTSLGSGITSDQTFALATFASEAMGGNASVGNDLGIILSRINSLSVNGTSGGTTYTDAEGRIYDTSKLRAIQNTTGVNFLSSDNKSILSSFEVLSNMAAQWQNMSDNERNVFTTMFGGKTGRQANTFNSLMNAWSLEPEKMSQYIDAIKNSEGTVDDQYTTMTNTLAANKTAAGDAIKTWYNDVFGSGVVAFKNEFYNLITDIFTPSSEKTFNKKSGEGYSDQINNVISSLENAISGIESFDNLTSSERLALEQTVSEISAAFPQFSSALIGATSSVENFKTALDSVKKYKDSMDYSDYKKSINEDADFKWSDLSNRFQDYYSLGTNNILNNFKNTYYTDTYRSNWKNISGLTSKTINDESKNFLEIFGYAARNSSGRYDIGEDWYDISNGIIPYLLGERDYIAEERKSEYNGAINSFYTFLRNRIMRSEQNPDLTEGEIWGNAAYSYGLTTDIARNYLSNYFGFTEISDSLRLNDIAIEDITGTMGERLFENVNNMDSEARQDILDMMKEKINEQIETNGVESVNDNFLRDLYKEYNKYVEGFFESGTTNFNVDKWRQQTGLSDKYQSSYYYLDEQGNKVMLNGLTVEEAKSDLRKRMENPEAYTTIAEPITTEISTEPIIPIENYSTSAKSISEVEARTIDKQQKLVAGTEKEIANLQNTAVYQRNILDSMNIYDKLKSGLIDFNGQEFVISESAKMPEEYNNIFNAYKELEALKQSYYDVYGTDISNYYEDREEASKRISSKTDEIYAALDNGDFLYNLNLLTSADKMGSTANKLYSYNAKENKENPLYNWAKGSRSFDENYLAGLTYQTGLTEEELKDFSKYLDKNYKDKSQIPEDISSIYAEYLMGQIEKNGMAADYSVLNNVRDLIGIDAFNKFKETFSAQYDNMEDIMPTDIISFINELIPNEEDLEGRKKMYDEYISRLGSLPSLPEGISGSGKITSEEEYFATLQGYIDVLNSYGYNDTMINYSNTLDLIKNKNAMLTDLKSKTGIESLPTDLSYIPNEYKRSSISPTEAIGLLNTITTSEMSKYYSKSANVVTGPLPEIFDAKTGKSTELKLKDYLSLYGTDENVYSQRNVAKALMSVISTQGENAAESYLTENGEYWSENKDWIQSLLNNNTEISDIVKKIETGGATYSDLYKALSKYVFGEDIETSISDFNAKAETINTGIKTYNRITAGNATEEDITAALQYVNKTQSEWISASKDTKNSWLNEYANALNVSNNSQITKQANLYGKVVTQGWDTYAGEDLAEKRNEAYWQYLNATDEAQKTAAYEFYIAANELTRNKMYSYEAIDNNGTIKVTGSANTNYIPETTNPLLTIGKQYYDKDRYALTQKILGRGTAWKKYSDYTEEELTDLANNNPELKQYLALIDRVNGGEELTKGEKAQMVELRTKLSFEVIGADNVQSVLSNMETLLANITAGGYSAAQSMASIFQQMNSISQNNALAKILDGTYITDENIAGGGYYDISQLSPEMQNAIIQATRYSLEDINNNSTILSNWMNLNSSTMSTAKEDIMELVAGQYNEKISKYLENNDFTNAQKLLDEARNTYGFYNDGTSYLLNSNYSRAKTSTYSNAWNDKYLLYGLNPNAQYTGIASTAFGYKGTTETYNTEDLLNIADTIVKTGNIPTGMSVTADASKLKAAGNLVSGLEEYYRKRNEGTATETDTAQIQLALEQAVANYMSSGYKYESGKAYYGATTNQARATALTGFTERAQTMGQANALIGVEGIVNKWDSLSSDEKQIVASALGLSTEFITRNKGAAQSVMNAKNADMLKEQTELYGKLADEAAKYNMSMDEFATAVNAGEISVDSEEIDQLAESYANLATSIDLVKESLDNMKTSAEESATAEKQYQDFLENLDPKTIEEAGVSVNNLYDYLTNLAGVDTTAFANKFSDIATIIANAAAQGLSLKETLAQILELGNYNTGATNEEVQSQYNAMMGLFSTDEKGIYNGITEENWKALKNTWNNLPESTKKRISAINPELSNIIGTEYNAIDWSQGLGATMATAEKEYRQEQILAPVSKYAAEKVLQGSKTFAEYGFSSAIENFVGGDLATSEDSAREMGQKYAELKKANAAAAAYKAGNGIEADYASFAPDYAQYTGEAQTKYLEEQAKIAFTAFDEFSGTLNDLRNLGVEDITDFVDSVENASSWISESEADYNKAANSVSTSVDQKSALDAFSKTLNDAMTMQEMIAAADQLINKNPDILSNTTFRDWYLGVKNPESNMVAGDYYNQAMEAFSYNRQTYGRQKKTYTSDELTNYFNQLTSNPETFKTNVLNNMAAYQREDLQSALTAKYGSYITDNWGSTYRYNTDAEKAAAIRAAQLSGANYDVDYLTSMGVIGEEAASTIKSMYNVEYGNEADSVAAGDKIKADLASRLESYNTTMGMLKDYSDAITGGSSEEEAKRAFLAMNGITGYSDDQLGVKFDTAYNNAISSTRQFEGYYGQIQQYGLGGFGYESALTSPEYGYTWMSLTNNQDRNANNLDNTAGLEMIKALKEGISIEDFQAGISAKATWQDFIAGSEEAKKAIEDFADGTQSANVTATKLEGVLNKDAKSLTNFKKVLGDNTKEINRLQYYINKAQAGTLTKKDDKNDFAAAMGLGKWADVEDMGMNMQSAIEYAKGIVEGDLATVQTTLSDFIAQNQIELTGPDVVVDQGAVTLSGEPDMAQLTAMFGAQQAAAVAAALKAGYVLTFDTKKTYDENGQVKQISYQLSNTQLGTGLSGGKNSSRSGGGGSKKSATDKLLEKQKRYLAVDKHLINMVKAQEEKYDTEGQLAAYGNMLELENVAQGNYITKYNKAIDELVTQMGKVKKGSDDWYKLRDAIMEYEEAIEDCNNAILENTKKLRENREAMRKTRSDLEETIKGAIEANEQFKEDKLAGTVEMQNTILDALRNRYQTEWDLMKEDLNKKREALEEEKALISERLQARKDAESEAASYEELAELQKQLALISMDTTMTSEALSLRDQIAKKQNELAWKQAEETANATSELLTQQVEGIDSYISYEDERVAEYLEDANNFAADVAEVLGGSSDDIMAWLRSNVDEYGNMLNEAQQQQVKSWLDTYKQMAGITETYWTQINEIIAGGWESIMAYMQTTQDYQTASATEKLSQLYEWQVQYDEYISAFKGTTIATNYDEYMAAIETAVDSGNSEIAEKFIRAYTELMQGSAVYDHYEYYNNTYYEDLEYISSGTEHISQNTDILVSTLQDISKFTELLNSDLARYATGGISTSTGLAWLDGTISDPEYIFTKEQMNALTKTGFNPLMTQLGSEMFGGTSNSIGDITVTINQAEISSDYDVTRLAELVGDKFVEQISTQGYRTSRF